MDFTAFKSPFQSTDLSDYEYVNIRLKVKQQQAVSYWLLANIAQLKHNGFIHPWPKNMSVSKFIVLIYNYLRTKIGRASCRERV